MEDNEAVKILEGMLKEHSFSEKEKEALLTAIGILSWSKLGQARIRGMIRKKKEEKGGYLEEKERGLDFE